LVPGAGRAGEESTSIGKGYFPTIGFVGAIYSMITLNHQFDSWQYRIFSPSPSDQSARWASFNHPDFFLTIFIDNCKVQPSVGINPFHPHDLAAQIDWLG
jgi:hypothetical protein